MASRRSPPPEEAAPSRRRLRRLLRTRRPSRRTHCAPPAQFRLSEHGHASRYQSFKFQKSLSQPLKVALSLFDIAATQRRFTTEITATSSTTMSFILINSAARLTGSSSPCAARKVLSYSSLRQRVGLLPCHLLSFEAISQDTNCCIKRSGSGTEGVPTVYIWISA